MLSESDKPTRASGRQQLTIILVMALFSLGGSYALFFLPRAVQVGAQRITAPSCNQLQRLQASAGSRPSKRL